MRCLKCGFATFDIHDGCPKCGKSVSNPIVRTISVRSPRKRGHGSSSLSSLTMGPIPRYFSNGDDPKVISLLGDVAVSAPPAPLDIETADISAEVQPAAAEPSTDDDIGEESWLEDESAPSGEPVEDSGFDPLEEENMASAGDAESSGEAALEDFDAILEEAGESGEAGEDPAALLEGLDELAEEEATGTADGGEDPFAGIEAEDLGGEAAAAAPESAADEAGESEDSENIDDMWADAFAEQEAGEAATAGSDEDSSPDEGLDDSVTEESGQDETDDDISNMWDEAFAEQEAAENQSSEEELGLAATAEARRFPNSPAMMRKAIFRNSMIPISRSFGMKPLKVLAKMIWRSYLSRERVAKDPTPHP
ncbi:MAG: hypothetical protein QF701_11260 [Nitrospinota bacterium]|nr:hypothetical protein [Nitrospinota bacterium]